MQDDLDWPRDRDRLHGVYPINEDDEGSYFGANGHENEGDNDKYYATHHAI
jgi:hypothetical protein